MTEPEQWAVELWEQGTRAWKKASGCDDPDRAAALIIQRAFEERERERINAAIETAKEAPPGLRLRVLVDCLRALATRQDAPKACSEVTSHDH